MSGLKILRFQEPLDELAHPQAQPQQGREQSQDERLRIAGNMHGLNRT
jgi:hypothetical protein